MKPVVFNVHDAKTQLSKLVARAEKGKRITIARAGKAVAQLGPLTKAKRSRGGASDADGSPPRQTQQFANLPHG